MSASITTHPAIAVSLIPFFQGPASAITLEMLRQTAGRYRVSVSIAPNDTLASVRDRLVADMERALLPPDLPVATRRTYHAIFAAAAVTAYPGAPGTLADPQAPPPPLGAARLNDADPIKEGHRHWFAAAWDASP
jgi:hypothetical protein